MKDATDENAEHIIGPANMTSGSAVLARYSEWLIMIILNKIKSDNTAVAEIPDQEIAHCRFRRKLRKWRFRFEECREAVAAAR
jgi:hypothetical protein